MGNLRHWAGAATAGLILAATAAACSPGAAPPSPSAPGGQPAAPAPGASQPAPAGGAPAAAPAAGEPQYGGTLILGQRDAPENMNFYAGVFASQVVFYHHYEPMVAFDHTKDFRVDYPVIPWLAEKWEQVDDMTWLFTIRDGVKWHDGTPLTAEGVVWSMEYLREAKNNFSARSNLNHVDKITAEGNKVRMTLKQANPSHLLNMREIVILPKHIFDAGGADALAFKSTGTGPFSLVSMDRNAKTIFKKNPNYWRKDEAGRQQPYLDGIQHIHNMDQSTQQAALAAGQLDVFNFADKTQSDSFLRSRKEMKVFPYQYGREAGMIVNFKRPYLDNQDVRMALHLILNRQEILDNAAGGDGLLGLPVVSAMKTGWVIPQEELIKRPGYRQPKTEDLAEAKRLLEKAGVPKDWQIVFLNRATFGSTPQGETAANQLKAFGLNVKYEALDDASYLRRQREGDFDLELELQANADPGRSYGLFHSKGAGNYGKLNDPEVDAIFDKLAATTDKAEHQKLTRQLQELFLSKAYDLPMIDPKIYTVYQPWIGGWVSHWGIQVYMQGNSHAVWMDMSKLPAARK